MARPTLRPSVLLWLLLGGCGGNATRGAATLVEAAAGVSDVPAGGEGAAGGREGADGSSAAGGAGDDAGDPSPPAIASGARYCDNDLYCFGFECYAPETLERRVCVSDCSVDADCQRGEVCLESPNLRAGCYGRCDHTSDCQYGFDCFDFTGRREMLVCFPTSWAAYWTKRKL